MNLNINILPCPNNDCGSSDIRLRTLSAPTDQWIGFWTCLGCGRCAKAGDSVASATKNWNTRYIEITQANKRALMQESILLKEAV
jgi:hypothetical protein